MEYLTNRKKIKNLIFLCWLVYSISYIGKLNYTSSIVVIIKELGITKAEAGKISSYFFFLYGIGQFVNGMLSEKYNSKIMIAVSLVASALLNVLMVLSLDHYIFMKFIWAANGFMQSILWSSIIKILAKYLPPDMISKAILTMSTTVAVGTFFIYSLSAICAYMGLWKLVFFLPAVFLIITSIIWFVGMGNIENEKENFSIEKGKDWQVEAKPFKKTFFIISIFLFVCAIANGFIKDGVITWVPNIISEKYNILDYLSIIISLILPLIAISGAFIAKYILKKFPNHLFACFLFFVSSCVFISILIFAKNALYIYMLMFSAIIVSMSAINNILTSAIPLYLRSYGKSGMIAGVINTFIYIGSTLSAIVIGYAADARGWNYVFIIILMIGLLSCLFSIVGAYFWRKVK